MNCVYIYIENKQQHRITRRQRLKRLFGHDRARDGEITFWRENIDLHNKIYLLNVYLKARTILL